MTILPAVILSFGGAFLGLLIADKMLLHAIIHWLGDVDWCINQKLNFAGGIRHGSGRHAMKRVWYVAHGGADGCLPQTCPPDYDDHHRHGCRYVAFVIGLGSADNSFRQPMAAAVIGGLITSTILELAGNA